MLKTVPSEQRGIKAWRIKWATETPAAFVYRRSAEKKDSISQIPYLITKWFR